MSRKFKVPFVTVIAIAMLICFARAASAQDNVELNTILMQSTFMIEGKSVQGSTQGTVFIMGRPYPSSKQVRYRYVLVTAAHVLEGMQGDSAVLHLRRKVGVDSWEASPFPIPIRANGQPLWTKNADVAVMYVSLPSTANVMNPAAIVSTDLLADDQQLSQFEIHPGDELYCLGYPLGMTSNAAGFPILRSGRIASYPLLPTSTVKTFLLDFPVFKGNSGGPVYISQVNRSYGGVSHLGESIHFIMGLVSEESTYNEQLIGQYSAELHQYQLGLAVVIQASVIKQTIEMLPSPGTLPE
jgi:S1-C subfamily serine protease